MKKMFLILIISALLIGCAYAANSVNDFKVDDTYTPVYNESDSIVYFNDTNTSGVCIFKYLEANDDNDDANDNKEDAVENIVMTDGDDYLTADDDYQLDKNSNNIANFTDLEHNNQGVVEVVEVDNEKFIIVFWSKNTDNQTDFESQLNDFNKDNGLEAVAF